MTERSVELALAMEYLETMHGDVVGMWSGDNKKVIFGYRTEGGVWNNYVLHYLRLEEVHMNI